MDCCPHYSSCYNHHIPLSMLCISQKLLLNLAATGHLLCLLLKLHSLHFQPKLFFLTCQSTPAIYLLQQICMRALNEHFGNQQPIFNSVDIQRSSPLAPLIQGHLLLGGLIDSLYLLSLSCLHRPQHLLFCLCLFIKANGSLASTFLFISISHAYGSNLCSCYSSFVCCCLHFSDIIMWAT
jgi:hypothetical protein